MTNVGSGMMNRVSQSHRLALIVVLAAVLRFCGLGTESLYIDEAVTVERLQQSGYSGLLTDWDSWTQGPVFYLLNNAWCDAFGYSEAALRFPAAVYGILAVLMLYYLARALVDPQAALLAALLFALNPYAVYYSQEARPYSLFLLAVTASVYFTIRLLRRFSRKAAVGYILTTLFALHTHPYGPFLLLLQGMLFFAIPSDDAVQRPRGVKHRWIAFAVVLVLCLPQMVRFGGHYLLVGDGVSTPEWIVEPNLWDLVRTLRYYVMFWPLAAAMAAVGVAGCIFAERRRAETHRMLIVLAACFASFYLLPWVVSVLFTPIFRPRYTIPALVPLCVLIGWALQQWPRSARRVAIAVLVLLSAIPLYSYYTTLDKGPWRQTAALLAREAVDGDVVVAHPGWTKRTLDYYLTGAGDPPVSMSADLPIVYADLDALASLWLVDSYDSVYPIDSLQAVLLERGMRPVRSLSLNDSIAINPDAYWVPRIRITKYSGR